MSVHEVIRKRIASGDTRLLADLRKGAADAVAAGDYEAAAALYDLEGDATAAAPTTEVLIGSPCEVDVGDGVIILGYIDSVAAAAKMVGVRHADEVTLSNGMTLPVGYVSTHPIDAVTILTDPEPAPEPPAGLPPVYVPKSAGVLVKSALANQVQHGGPVAFPDRPVTHNTASAARRRQEEIDACANR